MVNNPLPEVTDDGEPSEAVPPNAAPPAAESSAVRERTIENSPSGGSVAIQVSDLTGGRLTGAEAMNVQVSQSATNADMQKNDSADIGLPPNLTCDGIEMEKSKFKVPSKRKQSGEFQAARAKKLDVDDVFGEDGMDSGSESSDSSVGLSQSDLSSSNYGVDDIKLFLRATKNKRAQWGNTQNGYLEWLCSRLDLCHTRCVILCRPLCIDGMVINGDHAILPQRLMMIS
ncbi:hypothetical protein ROHU_020971 [Labeo rohita]|uniref:Uncharacterized protein n=1 Tax=Labeo rohita TaxID=84645 RepID=A0A498N3U5_LABRO|nr:hypothetical protein ROHU_020971 [Labeo rohita]